VIVRLEREHVEVLNMHGRIVRINPQTIESKRDSKFMKALDSQKNTIQVGDMVKVVEGPNAVNFKLITKFYIKFFSHAKNLTKTSKAKSNTFTAIGCSSFPENMQPTAAFSYAKGSNYCWLAV